MYTTHFRSYVTKQTGRKANADKNLPHPNVIRFIRFPKGQTYNVFP